MGFIYSVIILVLLVLYNLKKYSLVSCNLENLFLSKFAILIFWYTEFFLCLFYNNGSENDYVLQNKNIQVKCLKFVLKHNFYLNVFIFISD